MPPDLVAACRDRVGAVRARSRLKCFKFIKSLR